MKHTSKARRNQISESVARQSRRRHTTRLNPLPIIMSAGHSPWHISPDVNYNLQFFYSQANMTRVVLQAESKMPSGIMAWLKKWSGQGVSHFWSAAANFRHKRLWMLEIQFFPQIYLNGKKVSVPSERKIFHKKTTFDNFPTTQNLGKRRQLLPLCSHTTTPIKCRKFSKTSRSNVHGDVRGENVQKENVRLPLSHPARRRAPVMCRSGTDTNRLQFSCRGLWRPRAATNARLTSETCLLKYTAKNVGPVPT